MATYGMTMIYIFCALAIIYSGELYSACVPWAKLFSLTCVMFVLVAWLRQDDDDDDDGSGLFQRILDFTSSLSPPKPSRVYARINL